MSAPPAGRWRDILAAAVLILATFAAYYPAWHGELIWDDDHHLTPPHLQDADGLRRIWTEVGVVQQYYPITHSAFWIEHKLFGDRPLGYHLVNISLHCLNALLLVVLLRKLGIPGAWLAAAIFALHPVHVESVAWISELKNVLSTAFCLGAALCYLRYDRTKNHAWYGMALWLFAAGLGAKSVIAMLPPAMMILLWWRRGRPTVRDTLPLLPFFMFALSFGLFTTIVERKYVGAEGEVYQLTIGQHLILAGRALWFYAGKLAWPLPLLFMYPRWDLRHAPAWQFVYPIGAVVVLGVLFLFRRHARAAFVAAAIFAVLLFPALGFFNVYPFRYTYVADHFQYLASMSLITAVAAVVSVAARRLPIQACCALGVLALAGFSVITHSEAREYSGKLSLYNAVIKYNKTSWMAYNNRGMAHVEAGDTKAAIEDFSESIRLKPDHAEAHSNRANLLILLGRIQEGIEDCDITIRLEPNLPQPYINRANAYMLLGQHALAAADYDRAIELRSLHPIAYNNRASARYSLGRFPEGVADSTRAIELDPTYGMAHVTRAIGYTALGDYNAAWTDVHEAERLGATPSAMFLRRLKELSGRTE